MQDDVSLASALRGGYHYIYSHVNLLQELLDNFNHK